MGTAGLARVLVRGKRRLPAPPPKMMAAGTGPTTVSRRESTARFLTGVVALALLLTQHAAGLGLCRRGLKLERGLDRAGLDLLDGAARPGDGDDQSSALSTSRSMDGWGGGCRAKDKVVQLHTHLEAVHAPLAFDRPSIIDRPETHRSDEGITWDSAARACFVALLVRKPWR